MKYEPLTVIEIREIEAFLEGVTPGPWEEGVDYRDCGVNDGSDPHWEPPPCIPPGKCVACTHDDPLIEEYKDERGHTRHVHRWDQRLSKRKHWEDLTPEQQEECESREEFERHEEEFVDGRYACWHNVTSAATRQTIIGHYACEQGGVATNRTDAEFIARCREWMPRLLHTVEMLYGNQGDLITFPEEEIPQIRKQLDEYRQVITTRVLKEYDKYIEGQRLRSPWGEMLFVAKIERYTNLNDHPFFNELTEEQKEIIGDNPLDVLYLRKLWGHPVIHKYPGKSGEQLLKEWEQQVGRSPDATIHRHDSKDSDGGGGEE